MGKYPLLAGLVVLGVLFGLAAGGPNGEPKAGLVVLGTWFGCGPGGPDDEPKKIEGPALSDTGLEVQALRMLRTLNLTSDQQKHLLKLAKETAQPARARKGKAGAEFAKLLAEVRDALAQEDDDAVDSKLEKLEDLSDSEKPELDDGVEITDSARKHVAEVFKKLKATQMAAYIAAVADQIADPADELSDRLNKVRDLSLAEWKEQRDGMADGISKLLAGVDVKKGAEVKKRVLALLNQARMLKEEEDFQKKRPELEKTIEEIVSGVGPADVLKNVTEWALADLLSNPRLEAAIQARLAAAGK